MWNTTWQKIKKKVSNSGGLCPKGKISGVDKRLKKYRLACSYFKESSLLVF